MLTIVLAIFAGCFVLVLALLFFAQRSLLFPAPAAREAKAPGATVTRLARTLVLHRPAAAGERTLVYFHGNGDQVAGIGAWLSIMLPEVGLAAIEYPGYGGVPGAPTEESIHDAAVEGLKHLAIPNEHLVLLGQSIGSGVALRLAAEGWGSRLILLTPYTSIVDVAQDLFPFVPGFLIHDRFDSLSRAAQVKQPVLVIHGTRDEVVPFAQGKKLSGACPQSQFVEIPNGTHNDLWEWPEVPAAVLEFAAAP